jgi:hypothetical protein
MELIVLTVPDCPNAAAFEGRRRRCRSSGGR